MKPRSRFRACSKHNPCQAQSKLARCGFRAFCVCRPTSRRLLLSTSRKRAATHRLRLSEFGCRLIVDIRQCRRPYVSPPCQSNRLHNKFRTHIAAMMSFPHLPSQANSGYQQRTIQPPHALAPTLAPSPQSTVFVRV
jgi:hypothetical protein